MKPHNNEKELFIKVSVLVVTYNASYSKLVSTINSILKQNNIFFEIVISDDGSEKNYFSEIKNHFENCNFTNYILVENKKNNGTVRNVYEGLKRCGGDYVKTISPGDVLVDEFTLYDWALYMINKQSDLSFSKVVYYQINNNHVEFLKVRSNPQRMDIYNSQNVLKIQANYLLANDIVNGAAILCKTELLIKYIELLVMKVIYAEDNAIRIMIADGIIPCFYEENTVFYEYGTGVSTTKDNKWKELLRKDWQASNELILPFITDDRIKKKFLVVNNLTDQNRFFAKAKSYLLVRERLKSKLLKIKYSDVDYDKSKAENVLLP